MYNNIKEDVENQLSVKEQPNYDEYEVTDDDMDDGGGVVVAETFAVEDSVKIPIFGRDTI